MSNIVDKDGLWASDLPGIRKTYKSVNQLIVRSP